LAHPSPTTPFDGLFLSDTPQSLTVYQEAIAAATQILTNWMADQAQPYSGWSPLQLADLLAEDVVCPPQSQSLEAVLQRVGEAIVRHSVSVTHPTCIAHLHCPPLIPALAAEALISATNQSMDSWDQSPAATVLEQKVIDWLCQLFGYGAIADGTFTSGGTQSNFMGLLLARDAYAQKALNWNIQQQGLPPEAHRFRIVCSAVSHFTVQQSAALLGLGHQAVVTVEPDAQYRMQATDVVHTLAELKQADLIPIALVATAGTTDFGSIDALPELATCAAEYDLWMHVDTAVGGALMMSDRHRHKLQGIEAADSITIDFHKLFYQPISCGAFLVKNRAHFDLLKLHADYLNPESNDELGIPDLVTKSLQTTRRFDALKLYVSLQTLGRQTFGSMLEATIDLAGAIATHIDADPALELAATPEINAVVFRYLPGRAVHQANEINRQIRLRLLHQGQAVIAQTAIEDRVFLKLTLLNPRTQEGHLLHLLEQIKQLGRELD
jgi:L-2,4-diaminobutyrate decarboxylase